MGYSRSWTGSFCIEPPLADAHRERFDNCVAGGRKTGWSRCGWLPSASKLFVAGAETSQQTEAARWLEWDGEEKFVSGAEWLEYLIAAFFRPLGYSVSGTVKWEGEEPGDSGELSVLDGVVSKTEEQGEEFGDAGLAHWLAMLQAPAVEQRLEAITVLQTTAPWDRIVGAFAEVLLQDASERVRLDAAESLSAMEHSAKPAESALIQALSDSVDFVAAAAAQALGVLGSGAEVVSALEKAAQSPSWTLRYRANEALARLRANG